MILVCAACATKNRVPQERLADAPSCGRCGAPLMSSRPVPLTDETFFTFVAESGLPVLVDFWAAWCAPCRMMAPHFEQAAEQMPNVRFTKVDTELSPRAAMTYRIRSIPTLVLFRHGKERARVSGVLQAGPLLAWLRDQLAK